MRGTLRFGKKGKLIPRYVGPFKRIMHNDSRENRDPSISSCIAAEASASARRLSCVDVEEV